jgi:hypothetical protein
VAFFVAVCPLLMKEFTLAYKRSFTIKGLFGRPMLFLRKLALTSKLLMNLLQQIIVFSVIVAKETTGK